MYVVFIYKDKLATECKIGKTDATHYVYIYSLKVVISIFAAVPFNLLTGIIDIRMLVFCNGCSLSVDL